MFKRQINQHSKISAMKKMLFVSAGRCGTTRIAQILKECLSDEFSVQHQMPFSRLANIVGNIFYYFGESEKVKYKLYNFITSRYSKGKHFICTDPLTSMIIPKEYIKSEDVCIVHITREPKAFAGSLFNFSRAKFKSFIAHNFITFWQIGIWPLENLLNSNIRGKYKKVAKLKNRYFTEKYSSNPNYLKIDMDELFTTGIISSLIKIFFKYQIEIDDSDLNKKVNESTR